MENWNGLSVEPASIPHLLHWDLAYLWALEQAPDQLSPAWNLRVGAWKRLLELFIAGELEIVDGVVPTNLSELLRGYGITSVKELHYKDRRGKVLGILSPLTIVRPLPDVSGEECKAIPDPESGKKDAVIHLLKLLEPALEDEVSSDSPVPAALHRIVHSHRIQLEERLAVADLAAGTVRAAVNPLDTVERVSLLRACPAIPGTGPARSFILKVGIFHKFENRYVPTCTQCNARTALLSGRGQTVIPCSSDTIVLHCSTCGALNSVRLEKLFLSFPTPDRPRMIVWVDRERLGSDPVVSAPPPATITGRRIEFEWRPSESMHPERRFLTIEVTADYLIEEAQVESLFYARFLDCGGDHSAIPMRIEWANWLVGWPNVRRGAPDTVVSGVRVHGIPQEFQRVYTPLSVSRQLELGVGVYPSRSLEGWSDYRVFLTGNIDGWALATPVGPGFTSVAPALYKCDSVPRFVGVRGRDRDDTGAVWQRSAPPLAASDSRLDIGLDFGTTSTVLAFQSGGDRHGFLTQHDVVMSVEWLSKPATYGAGSTGLLPVGDRDSTLFPSALWVSGTRNWCGIRWSGATISIPESEAKRDLKWTSGQDDVEKLRTEYLTELLFWALPAVIKKCGLLSVPKIIHIGVAFPLAFSHPQRESFRKSLRELQERAATRFGVGVSCYSTSESDACVEVIGTIAPDDLFVVADMGGGSLDVAVVRARDNRLEDGAHLVQIGSIKYGGEICVSHLAENGGPSQYWQLRDSLAHGRPDPAFFSDRAKKVYDLHVPRALEFIRVQIEALRRAGIEGQVKVFLVGNGWRLSTLVDQQQDPHVAFCERYGALLKAMGCQNALLWTAPISDGNPKHIVALGARKNAAGGQRDELSGAAVSGRLPGGRTIKVAGTTVEWWELMGPGGIRIERPDSDIRAGIGNIEAEYEPAPCPQWKAYLETAIPRNLNTTPTAEALRQDLAQSLSNGRFGIGPLQVILEKFWSRL